MNRDQTIDSLKGVLIFLVTWGHLIQFVTYRNDLAFYTDPTFKAIYIFHMPLFMAVSGYLSFFSIRRSGFLSLIGRRAKSLLFPCFFWAVVTTILEPDVHGFAKSLATHLFDLWFLWALFAAIVVVSVMKLLRLDGPIGLISACIASLAIPGPFVVSAAKFTLPFFASLIGVGDTAIRRG